MHVCFFDARARTPLPSLSSCQTAAPANQVGASRSGAELGAKIHGVKPASCSRHASSHVNAMQKITLDLGANDYGVETCKLSVNCYDAELRVYFLKDTARGVFVKLFQKNDQKAKNLG